MNPKTSRYSPSLCGLLAAVWLASGGCADGTSSIRLDNPELEAFLELVLPRRIEIQRYLTKPISFTGGAEADGLEVMLAAHDAAGDFTKLVGTVHFELHTMRMASGDRVGERIALWPVELTSKATMVEYWDSLSRFYRFPLKLDGRTLAPGRYILNARLISPTGTKLFDQYEFSYEAGSFRPGGAGS